MIFFIPLYSLCQPPAITYQTPNVYTVSQAIDPLGPVNTGGEASGTTTTTVLAKDLETGASMMAVDDAGNVYINTNFYLHNRAKYNRILKIAADGTQSSIAADLPDVLNMAIDRPGKYLYIVDLYNVFWRIETATGVETKLGTGIGWFGAVTADDAGNAYITYKGSILKYAIDGSITTIGALGNNPWSVIAVDPSGTVVYTLGSTVDHFYIYTTKVATGETSSQFINLDNGYSPGNMIVDRRGTIILSILPWPVWRTYDPNTGVTTNIDFFNPLAVRGKSVGTDKYGDTYLLGALPTASGTDINSILKFSTVYYAIDKPLPAGLQFDRTTGLITGKPAAVSPATDYTVTAYNSSGSSSTIVNIKVDQAPELANQVPVINYNTPNLYTSGQAIAPLIPVSTGGAIKGGTTTTFVASNLETYPQDIAVDGAGNVYITNASGSVNKIALNGATSTLGQQIPHTFKLAIDKPGKYLYVVDYFGDFWRIETATGIVTKLGSGGFGAVAADDAGNAYVTHASSVQKYSVDGSVTTLTAFVTRSYPNLAVNAAGTKLYLSESGPDSFYINVYNIATGQTSLLPISVPSRGVFGNVTIDAGENVYVSDNSSNEIFEYVNATGSTTNTPMPGGGETYGYLAVISIDNNGTMYALTNYVESNSAHNIGRVLKFLTINYAIDKPLPNGLTFNQQTGVISGTPVARSPATDYTITAYNSNGTGSAIVNIKVDQALLPSVITFLPPAMVQIGADNILRPIISSTNIETPITYTSNDPAVAYIGADGLIHVIAPGPVTITASQSGNENYSAAAPIPQIFHIMQDQLILFPALLTKNACDADFDAGASTSNPFLPVSYSSSNPSVATVSEQGTIHILTAGTTRIIVSQNGNELFYAALPQTHDLTVNAPIIPLVTIAPDKTEICKGEQVTFTAAVSNVSAGLNYQWKVNGVNAGLNSSTFITAAAAINDNFQCVVTNNGSCAAVGFSNNYSTVIVNEYVTPAVTISLPVSGPVCGGTLLTFTATPGGASNPAYQWLVNNKDAGVTGPVFKTANLLNSDNVSCKLIVSSGKCFTATTAISNLITVNISDAPVPPPSVSVTIAGDSKYEGSLITFNAVAANAGTVNSYIWQVNGVSAGSNNPLFSSNSLRNNDVVTCTITSSIACSVPVPSSPLILSLLPPLSINIPNTFTPNGDGVNDLWDIPALASFPNSTVAVYNRYGKQVFYTRGSSIAWNGMLNGNALPFATYYYVVDLGQNNQKLSGSVTIIK